MTGLNHGDAMGDETGIDRLVGTWTLSGLMDIGGRQLPVTGHATVEPLGAWVVLRSNVQPAEFPSSVSVIARGPERDPADMHYFDTRGVRRHYRSIVDGDRWDVELDDPAWRESPGFRQRYVGEIAADGSRITGAWQRAEGDEGDWEVDFSLDYIRTA
jgi:hypothetical protein